MNGRNNQKIYGRRGFKILAVPFFILLAFLAVVTGIQAGEILYRLDANLIGNIDPETFRDTIKLSLPLIENVYNNGKSSTSFTGEIKDLFTGVFGFDLDSPVTILNVQSPLFMSYYNKEYKKLTALEGSLPPDSQRTPGTNGSSDAEGNAKGNNAGKNEPAAGSEDGKGGTGRQEGTEGGNKGNSGGSAGKGPDNTDGSGKGTDDTGSGNKGNTGGGGAGAGNSDGGGKNPGTAQNGSSGNKGMVPVVPDGSPLDLQPISSITYEEEDDEEKEGSNTVETDKVVVKNFTNHKIDIAQLLKEPLKLKFDKSGPKVLVYHTHTSESYVLRPQDIGKKNVASYNTNPKYNVVRVGEELSRYLRKYGIETLHNGTVHDKVRNAAYGQAIETLQSYKKSYPSIKVFIDVHRDGLDASKPKLRMTKNINGKNAAQVMFVVGTDDMLPHPQWKENLKFVLRVQQKLNEKYPGLARPVWVVKKRYNQQISNQAVLIEIGGDGNLLSECLESTRYVAEALYEVMNGK